MNDPSVLAATGFRIVMDVIFDTTDSELNCAPFAHVVFSPMVDPLLDAITQSNAALRSEWFGTRVQGF